VKHSSFSKIEIRRCKTCLMPQHIEHSDFNTEEICAWCRAGYPTYQPLGIDKLLSRLAERKTEGDRAQCLVGLSGGKDSSYSTLYLSRDLGVKVEAFTYLHDGSTSLGQENAAELCRMLGITHHKIRLKGASHRDTALAFFRSWVRTEDPVAAAMICVACKHLHLMGPQLARRRGIPLVVWSMCPLETPPFIPTSDDSAAREQQQSFSTLLGRLSGSCGSISFLSAFLHHLPICVLGCLSYRPECKYVHLRYQQVDHLQFFDYVPWNPRVQQEALTATGIWCSPRTDWHSDCIFNVLKEYMFQKMYLTSYTDAFLSSCIRHGLVTREQGIASLAESKRYFRDVLPRVLDELGLVDCQTTIDLSCFDVSIS